MISRRAALGTGAAVVVLAGGAHVLGVDDDTARALGVPPRSEPDPGDTALLSSARRTQVGIVAALTGLVADDRDRRDLLAMAREQLDALGGTSPGSDSASDGDQAARLLRRGAEQAHEQCVRATSPALVRVLASLSVGRSQLAAALGSGSGA